METRAVTNNGRAVGDTAGGGRSVPAPPPAPKEHGAYAQLGLPLVAALASGWPGLAALLLVAAAVGAFLAHEPLLVVLGHRGKRAERQGGGRARMWLAALGVGTVATGVAGLALGPPGTLTAAVVPAVFGLALVPFIWRKEEKTAAGEFLAAAAMSGAALPVAVASGLSLPRAFAAWGTWVLAFAASTAAVRATIAHAKRRREASALFGYWEPLAATPMLAVAWTTFVLKPHPRNLKRMGWMLAAASLVTAGILVALART